MRSVAWPGPGAQLWFGGDVNPEQWSAAEFAHDIALMRRAGVTTVTVGPFAWSSLEPRRGDFRFDWLDRALDALHAAGIGVILATPTASPPPWFTALHPEAMPETADGVRLRHGSRDTYNPAAPAYREAAIRITRALADRYATHPALVMWHLHNEYGTVSHGPLTDRAFRVWLQHSYGSLEALNDAWTTAFWSQGYGSWSDIHAPGRTQYLPNPTQMLDFRRFCAAILLDCLREQLAVVREVTPEIPTTTNLILPTWNHIDQWDFARELDVISIDHYLDSEQRAGEEHVAFASDLARSLAGGKPWLLMEQATSLIYDYEAGRFLVKEPGRMRRNTLQYIARGASGSLFFQWRAPRGGAEFFHSAMVPHAGADTRVFAEIESLGAELASLAGVAEPPVEGPVVAAKVAILWGADAWWSSLTRGLPSTDVAFLPAVRAVHASLWRAGIAADFVSPEGPFDRYDLVLIPSALAMSDTHQRLLESHVARGGHLAAWFLAGTTDESLRVRPGTYSGAFAGLAGVRVEEHVPLRRGVALMLSDGSSGSEWSERVELRGADAVATYTSDAHPVMGEGSPAITRFRHESGGVVHYVSTRLATADLDRHVERMCAEAGVAPTHPEAGADLEIVERRAGEYRYLFAINHSTVPREVRVAGTRVPSGREVRGALTIPGGGAEVVRL